MSLDWAGIVEAEGAALGDAAGDDPGAAVPAAPGWDMTDLVRHVAMIHLHATDGEGEWLIRFDPGDVVVESGHAKGDAAVRGPAGDLLLWLYGRVPLDDLQAFGDPGAAAALRQVTTV